MSARLDTVIEVEAPEHVLFEHQVAGPGTRLQAWLVDAALMAVVLFAAASTANLVFGTFGAEGASQGTLMLAWFAVDWGWFTLTEGLLAGQSPGKRFLGVRVVCEDGRPIGWREAILRNLLRPADSLPFGYVVGALVMGLDPRSRRIGDRLAGTVVVVAAQVRAPTYEDSAPPTELERVGLPRHLHADPALTVALAAWSAARERLGATWADAVAARVAPAFRARWRLPAATPARTLELLLWVARQDEADAEQGLARRSEPWGRFTTLLEDVERRGRDVGRIAAGYRDLCADLGRARNAGVRPTTIEWLHGICARAHDQIYGGGRAVTRLGVDDVARLLLVELPAQVRALSPWMLASALFFVGPALLGFVLANVDPGFAAAVLPAAQRQAMEAAYADEIARTGDENAMMAGFYVMNNVGIALRSIAAGIFLGVGTAWVLLSNGLILGTVAGHLTSMGLGPNLLRFTAGHSAWELTALVIAGGGGLRLGGSLVLRDGLTLSASLRRAGPAVARVAACAALMLGIAAAIEGFWSGNTLPDWLRAAFALAQVTMVTAWLSGRLGSAGG